MPDFLIDRVIKLKSKEQFIAEIDKKVKFGRGSIRGIHSVERRGGNAVNIAYCLAKLGVKTKLFTVASQSGRALLEKIFSKYEDVATVHVSSGRHGLTTALEFLDTEGKKANVMLNDSGGNERFGSDRISSKEYLEILNKAAAVVVVNWGSNPFGSELYAYLKNPLEIVVYLFSNYVPNEYLVISRRSTDWSFPFATTISYLSQNSNQLF